MLIYLSWVVGFSLKRKGILNENKLNKFEEFYLHITIFLKRGKDWVLNYICSVDINNVNRLPNFILYNILISYLILLKRIWLNGKEFHVGVWDVKSDTYYLINRNRTYNVTLTKYLRVCSIKIFIGFCKIYFSKLILVLFIDL